MSDLRVPLAVDEEGRLWPSSTAQKGKTYFCPACHEPVILKQGEIRIAHFAHKVSDVCNLETIVHKTAKLLVQQAVHRWKSGQDNAPLLHRACQICGHSIRQPLPEKVDQAVLEYKLSDGSVADVVLLVGETAQAAIEIRVTHAVDVAKASSLPIPFIELDGYQVIENPTDWEPVTDGFKPFTCDQCKSTYSKFQTRLRQVTQACGVELPTAYYRSGICKCWKCDRDIIVFAWPKSGIHEDSAPQVKPPPRTVQYRFSKTVGSKYWANTCPFCQSIQGDFFLFAEPEGPFFGVEVDVDSRMAFDLDMMRIANQAAQNGLIVM